MDGDDEGWSEALPSGSTLISEYTPVHRSRTYTSVTPFVSAATNAASDVNATCLPFAEITALPCEPATDAPVASDVTSVVVRAVRSRT